MTSSPFRLAIVLLGCVAPALGAQVVHNAPFVTNPLASTDFATLPANTDADVPWLDGGVSVTYHSSAGSYGGNGGYFPANTVWFGAREGYTSVGLAGGESFNEIDFKLGSGWFGSGAQLFYQVLLGNTVLSTGSFGAAPIYQGGFLTFGFSDVDMDEVRLHSGFVSAFTVFNADDALMLDDVRIESGPAVEAVPEPASVVLLATGLAAIVALHRRRRSRTGL